MKKSTVATLAFVLAAVVIAAFLWQGRSGDRPSIVIAGEEAANLQALKSIEDEYEELADVNLDFRGFSFEDALSRTTQDFANGTGLYDIVMQYNFSLSSFVENHYVEELEPLLIRYSDSQLAFQDALFQDAWQEVGYYRRRDAPEAVKVGFPFASNTMLMVYNRVLFEDEDQRQRFKEQFERELTPPQTWSEYLEAARFFTQPQNDTFGVVLQGAAGGWLYYEWCNFVFGYGGTVMDKRRGWESSLDIQLRLTDPSVVRATRDYLDLKGYSAGPFLATGAYEQLRIMKEGNVALALIWSDLALELATLDGGGYDERFAFLPIPGDVSGLAGGSFFINAHSKVKDEALDFIVWVMQPEIQERLLAQGLSSALSTVYSTDSAGRIPYGRALGDSLERGVYMFEAGPDSDLVSTTLTAYLQRIWKGELTVEDGLAQAQQEIQEGRELLFRKPEL